MLLRGGKIDKAEELFSKQTTLNQNITRETCDMKKESALSDIKLYGRVVLSTERKSIERVQQEKGQALTAQEVNE